MMLCNTNPTARWGLLTATLSLLMAGALYAQPQARQVAEINTSEDSWAGSRGMTVYNGELYFEANDGVHGAELWKSDGTTATLVKDIHPGSTGSSPGLFVEYQGLLFFIASDGLSGTELWMTNGTEAGTERLTDLNQGANGSNPSGMYVFNNKLYFAADDGIDGRELWETDGTEANTIQVADINTGVAGSSPASMTEYNGELYFAATRAIEGRELFKLDTSGIVDLVYDINTGSGSSELAHLCAYGNALYFNANDGINGKELWVYDGQSNPSPFYEFATGSVGGDPKWLTVFNNELYFTATQVGSGNELWKWDGSLAPPLVFGDIRTGSSSSYPVGMCEYNSALYFSADDGINGIELWSTDGSSAPVMVNDLNPNGHGDPQSLTAFNGKLYFCMYTSLTGYELWRTDGANNVELAHDINKQGDGVASDADFVELNNDVYFFGRQNGALFSLYRCDTNGEVEWVLDTASDSGPAELTVVGQELYFIGNSQSADYELWRCDPGQRTLAKIVTNQASEPAVGNLVELDGKLYFTANDSSGDHELFEYTPAAGGAGQLVKIDVNPTGPSNPTSLTRIADILYFMADDGSNGFQLCYYAPGSETSAPQTIVLQTGGVAGAYESIVSVDGGVCVIADDGSGNALWYCDLSATPTKLAVIGPDELVSLGGDAYFLAETQSGDYELHRFDPMSATLAVIDPEPSASSFAYELTVLGDSIYYACFDAGTGLYGLWSYDPGSESLRQVVDFTATPESGWDFAGSLVRAGDMILFHAYYTGTSEAGEGVWYYNESSGDVGLVTEYSSIGNDLYAIGNRVFFVARTTNSDWEPWMVELPAKSGDSGDDDSGCSAKQGGRPAVFILLAALFAIALVTRRKHTRQMVA